MSNVTRMPEFALDRVVLAVQNVERRLMQSTAALDVAGIPYAVSGGNAVAVWVSTVDEGAVRNTPDVDILIRREDFDRVVAAMAGAGFAFRIIDGVDLFVDGPQKSSRGGVHILYAGEKFRPNDIEPSVQVTDSVTAPAGFSVLTLEALVRMKLISYRLKDQVHLQDLLRVGLFDATWTSRFRPELASRLQIILDDPEG